MANDYGITVTGHLSALSGQPAIVPEPWSAVLVVGFGLAVIFWLVVYSYLHPEPEGGAVSRRAAPRPTAEVQPR
jgi:hypothetical protein